MIIKYRMFIKFGFFSHFLKTFLPKLPEFFSFCANFINFPHLDTETQKTPCLINFGYAGKNYTVRLFHPVRLLRFWYFSTLYVYSVLYVY